MKKFFIISIALLISLGIASCGTGTDFASGEALAPARELSAHDCFIAEDLSDRQWRQLYERMAEEGLKTGVYVEALGDDLPQDYSKQELLQVAIEAQVDGIFLEGDSSEETAALINRATEAGIPVITLLSDAPETARVSHLEVGNYRLGQAYGQQIIDGAAARGLDGTADVLVIVDAEENRESRGVIISAMTEYVADAGEGLSLNVTMETVGVGVFSSAQAVRRRILSIDRVPDFILLFTERDTVNTYQVLVDYNMIDAVTIIGCSTSETILNAVSRGAVQSVIVMETEQMAQSAVRAMNEYRETGHVSEYVAIDTVTIDATNAADFAKEMPDA